jgi:hypothetical protein
MFGTDSYYCLLKKTQILGKMNTETNEWMPMLIWLRTEGFWLHLQFETTSWDHNMSIDP